MQVLPDLAFFITVGKWTDGWKLLLFPHKHVVRMFALQALEEVESTYQLKSSSGPRQFCCHSAVLTACSVAGYEKIGQMMTKL